MRSGAYQQNRIMHGNLPDFDAKYKVEVLIKPRIKDKLLRFDKKITITKIASTQQVEIRDIDVYDDTIIVLVLDQTYFSWRWSKRYDAVTTKTELSYYYGNLCYIASSDGSDDFTKVAFQARADRDGQRGTYHGLSFNVEIEQPKEIAGVQRRWLEVTLDPDVGNPPRADAPEMEPIADMDGGGEPHMRLLRRGALLHEASVLFSDIR
jgi:hypothetical protein